MKLYLQDGTAIEGESFGAEVPAAGEVVFNTGMMGYVEGFTDPSYAGQIVVCTYPLIGNYGVPDLAGWESEKVQIAGLVVSEYSENFSHHTALRSLGDWLRESGVPAITGVDTRRLTKKLREKGVMLGALGEAKPKKFYDPNVENLVAKVSITGRREYGSGKTRIVMVDCGMKENNVRSLLRPGITLIRVPWDYDFSHEEYDALFISNGPGDPAVCLPTIAHIKAAMKTKKPILGICLGNQLLALAAGAKTYKLKYGHRAQNQPALEHTQNFPSFSPRCFVTSQNHGFAVDAKTLPSSWRVWFTNANDGSVEGIAHKTLPFRAVQFHPEASPGPTDTAWIFDEFVQEIRNAKGSSINN